MLYHMLLSAPDQCASILGFSRCWAVTGPCQGIPDNKRCNHPTVFPHLLSYYFQYSRSTLPFAPIVNPGRAGSRGPFTTSAERFIATGVGGKHMQTASPGAWDRRGGSPT